MGTQAGCRGATTVARAYCGTWAGGRIAALKGGRKRWLLERAFAGKQHTIPLPGVRDEEGALAALYAWRADPAGFLERHQQKRRRDRGLVHGAVRLESGDLDALKADQERRGLSPRYIHSCVKHGREWLQAWRGVDLRHVTRSEVHAVLAKLGGNHHKRVLALKALCALLVNAGRLDPAHNPGRHVTVPPARPERAVRTKGYSAATLAAVYALLPDQDVRDAFRLQASTGMHASEVSRIAESKVEEAWDREPLARLTPLTQTPAGTSAIAGTVTVWHKRGSPHTISLDAACFAAALRLQRQGRAPGQGRMWRQLQSASRQAGVPQVRAAELRHSFVALAQAGRWVTPAGDSGLSLEEVAAVTGHRSSRTTARFYNVQEVPRLLDLSGVLTLTHAREQRDSGGQAQLEAQGVGGPPSARRDTAPR
jgi:integrase